MKKIIATALAVIAITATAIIAVPALAKEEPSQTQATVQTAAIVTPIATTASNNLYLGYGAAFCGGGLVMDDTVTLQRVAAALGITYDQLVKDLQNGQTIATIASAQKVDLTKVIDTVVAAQTDMVNTLVKYGYVTQDEANTIISNLRVRVESILSAAAPAANFGYGNGCFGIEGIDSASFVPGYGDGCYGIEGTHITSPVVSGIGYGYGMMGGAGRGMMGW